MHKFCKNICNYVRCIQIVKEIGLPLLNRNRNKFVDAFIINFKYENTRSISSSCCLLQNEPLNEAQQLEKNKGHATEMKLMEEEEKKLKILKLEYDVFYSTGVRVPSKVTDEQWMELLRKHTSISSRKRFYSFLFCIEKSTIHKKEKAQANVAVQNKKKLEIIEKQKNGLLENFKNTYLLFMQERTMNAFYYNNIYWAMIHGPHLIFDFGFEEHLSEKELKDLMSQIYHSHGINKIAKEPFHFHFCNLDPSGLTYRKLLKTVPNIEEVPITISDQSYLQHYPRDKLIYLSPNATEVMTHFDFDITYIIGSIVDKSVEVPLTMAKAKKEKVRMMKFPLDKYVKWVQGSKALSLNHVVDILLHMKSSQNWSETLTRCLPKRKFVPITEEETRLKDSKKYKNKNSSADKSFEGNHGRPTSIARQMKLPTMKSGD